MHATDGVKFYLQICAKPTAPEKAAAQRRISPRGSRLVDAQPITLLPVGNTPERELPGICFGGFPLQHDAKWITGTGRLIT